MKLYRTPTGHWAGNRDEATALASQYKTSFEQCEVPYDKAGLLSFLNEHKVGASNSINQDEPQHNVSGLVLSVEPVEPAEPIQPVMQKVWDRMAIEEAILIAPLDTALALGELVMSRMRDFAKVKTK